MKKPFGTTPKGEAVTAYTISCGKLTAEILDLGATLYRMYVPDQKGVVADVVLGFDAPADYIKSTTFFGATIGRNSNRVGKSTFSLGGKEYHMTPNEGDNNLHSGPDYYKDRVWQVVSHTESAITMQLESPDGDQGFPGNATIQVTYALEPDSTLRISYDGICDQDTVFNMTNHSYFNMAGHDHPEKAMDQFLCMPARHFTPDDAESIPTGELCPVEGTPMDFRIPKPIGRDLGQDYEALKLQGGYDHNFEVYTNPCAVLTDPESGRTMSVSTDCCGIQFYSGNFLEGEVGKDGVSYVYRGGVALETQFYPDNLNNPGWKQSVTKAGVPYHSETTYSFK